MKKNSKEFEELRSQFEKDLKSMPFYVSGKAEREDRESPSYYTNGEINNLFIAYMFGYQTAKCWARIGALELNG